MDHDELVGIILAIIGVRHLVIPQVHYQGHRYVQVSVCLTYVANHVIVIENDHVLQLSVVGIILLAVDRVIIAKDV